MRGIVNGKPRGGGGLPVTWETRSSCSETELLVIPGKPLIKFVTFFLGVYVHSY